MLLTHTTSKSIIVIEDIDCSLDLTGSRVPEKQDKTKGGSGKRSPGEKRGNSGGGNITSKVTLSGLLNFTDGLWSCLGNERIIVFTTNHIEKLDPGLLRPGRMDMHIHMSFCNFEVFKVLAINYLSVSDHPLFEKIEQLLREENVRITPAEVTEFLFQHKADKELALQTLAEDLVQRTVEGDSVDEDTKDGDVEEEPESADVAEELASRDQNGEEDIADEKPCKRVHCNVPSHSNQADWFKVYVDYKQKVQRQGGLGKRLPTRSRTSRF